MNGKNRKMKKAILVHRPSTAIRTKTDERKELYDLHPILEARFDTILNSASSFGTALFGFLACIDNINT